MKVNLRKFGSAVTIFALLLLCAETAFAYKNSYDTKMIENMLENDKILMGLALLDMLVVAIWLHKIYRSRFTVWYFSFSALVKELIIIFLAAGAILFIVPVMLQKAGLLSSKVLYIYLGAIFLLACRRKSKKQQTQTDKQTQNTHQELPSTSQKQTQPLTHEQTTTTPQQTSAEKTPTKIQKTYEPVLGVETEALIKRANIFLEDDDFDEADRYFEQALNQAPENSMAYLGKLMVELKVHNTDELSKIAMPLKEHKLFQRALKFANDEEKIMLEGYIEAQEQIKEAQKQAEDEKKKEFAAKNEQKKKSKTGIFALLIIVAGVFYGYQKISENKSAKQTAQPSIEAKRSRDKAEQKKIEQAKTEVKRNSEVDNILKGIENGDADAQFRLGYKYYSGQNVKKDYDSAIYWLKKSYEQGNVEAQFLLAIMYDEGHGVNKDKAQAFKLMNPIAEKNPSSIKNFYVFETNNITINSPEKLVAGAQTWLGIAYLNGEGVQKNNLQAKYWLQKAEQSAKLDKDKTKNKLDDFVTKAKNGDDDAQLVLALSHLTAGVPTDDDIVQGLSLLKKSYEQGNVEAQFLIAFSNFMQGKECFKLMKPIAEKNPNTIKKVYGLKEKDGSTPYSSAEEMVALAQYVIGTLYADGAGTEKNYEQAEYWFRKSLAHINEGLKEDVEKAIAMLPAVTNTRASAARPSNDNLSDSDAEYKQMMKNPEFAKADKALNNALQNAKKSLSDSDFNALKQRQNEWLARGRDEWVSSVSEYFDKITAYTIATRERAKYIDMLARGCSAATVTGNKVNVRSKPNTKSKVLFQVSRYIHDERERLIIDNNFARDNKGDIWYKVLYVYSYTPDSGDSGFRETNGYINGRFISTEPLTESDFNLMMSAFLD